MQSRSLSTRERLHKMSAAAKKGASLAVAREPVVGLRSGPFCWSYGLLRACSLITSLCEFPDVHPVTALQTRLTVAWLGWAPHRSRPA
jgi:hypothetical protein